MNRLRNISSADCIILTRAELSPKLGDGRVRRERLELGIYDLEPSLNFIPMIILGNPALAVLVSDKQFEGLCGSASV